MDCVNGTLSPPCYDDPDFLLSLLQKVETIQSARVCFGEQMRRLLRAFLVQSRAKILMLSPSVTCPNPYSHHLPTTPYLADIDECVNDTICGNHGLCENTKGSFRCHCDQGYTNPPGDASKCVGMYIYLYSRKSALCVVIENNDMAQLANSAVQSVGLKACKNTNSR